MQHTKLAAAILAAISANALANPQLPAAEFTLDEIVVTATRIPTPAKAVLSDVTILTAEQIAQSGAISLSDLLASTPGVETTVNGGLGGNQNVRVRGTSANHLLVLIDGQRLDSATTGATALEHLPLHAIDRIELVRSPASSLYGMNALGGVMQIFTKQGESADKAVELALGTYGFRQANADLSTKNGPWRLALSLGHTENNGFSSASPKALYGAYDPDRDAYWNDSVKASIGYGWKEGEVTLGVLNIDSQTEYDDSYSGRDYSDQTLSSQTLRLRQEWMPGFVSSLHIGASKDNMLTVSGNPSRFQTEQQQVTIENTLRLSRGEILLGAEYLRQEVASTASFSQNARQVKSLFAGYGARMGPHSMQMNVRKDDNSQFGAKTTGGGGYGYEIQEGVRIHASTATAFKAPTFNDLYFPLTDYGYGYTYEGNASLKSERSRNLEMGVTLSRGDSLFKATRYRQRVSDLIVASNGTLTDGPANVGSAEIDGLEVSGRKHFGAFLLDAGLTRQNAINAETHKDLTYRANRFGYLKVSRHNAKQTWGAELRFEGLRFDDVANTRSVAGYGVLNLSFSQELARDWQLRMRLDNALDKTYEQSYGFNTPGRSLFVTLRYAPK